MERRVRKGPFSAVTSDSPLPSHHTEHLAVAADTLGASTALATVGGDTASSQEAILQFLIKFLKQG